MKSIKEQLYVINYGSNLNVWSQAVNYVNRYIYSYSLVTKITNSSDKLNEYDITVASNDPNNSFSDDFFIKPNIDYYYRFYVDTGCSDNIKAKEAANGSGNSIFIPRFYNDISQVLPIHFINFFLFLYAFRKYVKVGEDFNKTGIFWFEGKEMSVDVANMNFANIEIEMRKEIFRKLTVRSIIIYCYVYWQSIFLLLCLIIPVLYSSCKYLGALL
jgi:hypothetical protein